MSDFATRLSSLPRRPADLARWATIVVAFVVAGPAVADGSVAAVVALAIAVAYGVYSTLRADEVHLLEDVAFLLAVIAAAVTADEVAAFLALVVVSLAIVAYRDFMATERTTRDPGRTPPAGPGRERGVSGAAADDLPRLLAANERRRAIRAADRAGEWLTFAMVGLDRLDPEDPRVGELRDDMEAALDELRTRVDLVLDEDDGVELWFDERLNALAEGARDLHGWEAATDIAPEREVSAPVAPLMRQALLDIAAEALDNAGRHSAAETVTVTWAAEGEGRRLEVRDDGFGFDVAAQAAAGIDAMTRTARAIGAAFDITSEADVGTAVVVVIPGSRLRGAATTAGGDPRSA